MTIIETGTRVDLLGRTGKQNCSLQNASLYLLILQRDHAVFEHLISFRA